MAGGTTVTINGANLTGATSVRIGGIQATSLTIVSPTQITAVTPAAAGAGVVDVVVTTAGGTATAVGAYTYIAAPIIHVISPAFSPVAGGYAITITGENFAGTTSVMFGGVEAMIFVVDSVTQITVTAPANASGPADVVVTTAGGSVTATGAFMYIAP